MMCAEGPSLESSSEGLFVERMPTLFLGATFATMTRDSVAMRALLIFFLALAICSPSAPGQESGALVLLFAGDVVLSDHVEKFIGDDLSYILRDWNEFGAFDFLMVNLEHPITTATARVEKKFNFKMHPRLLPILVNARVSIVNLANNHIADYGREGMEDTMRNLEAVGIRYVGAGRNLAEARQPVILEKNGVRIAFLGYYGGGEFAATERLPGFAPRRSRIVVEDVRKARVEADYVVVNFHWGVERAEHPEPEQMVLARQVIDAGADLIVGHHPHVLQGIESYRGKHIVYSLGNFVFGGNSLHTYDTALLKVELTRTDARVSLIPVRVEQWRPRPAEGEQKERILRLVNDRSKIFQTDLLKGSEE
jgi:poly-gamma-glutamate capsule biosynthesis protein CapA/YwtB (metallophosphatase superfamily)